MFCSDALTGPFFFLGDGSTVWTEHEMGRKLVPSGNASNSENHSWCSHIVAPFALRTIPEICLRRRHCREN